MKHTHYRIRMRYGAWFVDLFGADGSHTHEHGPHVTRDQAATHAATLNLRNGDHR